MQQLIDLAVKAGRKVAVSGRSMVNNTQMALELGYLHAPETVLIDIEDINKYPPEKIVLITTGSQGNRSARCPAWLLPVTATCVWARAILSSSRQTLFRATRKW